MSRARIALAALAYAALTAHLLFIPYAFRPLTFEDALHRLAQMAWMQLGSDQNVALVSRALMFLPLGLLLAASVVPRPRRRIELAALLVASVLGCVWAMGVNFAQLWFPSRTVSLNNLIAEAFGVTCGALLWSTLGATGLQWWHYLMSGGRTSVNAALGGYVVLYVLASLTPFDFVVSGDQLAEKVASGLYGFWLAPISCGQTSCALKFLSVVVAAIPCGWWLAIHKGRRNAGWLPMVLIATLVATIIEVLHFLMVSGVSQGASVFFRTLGMLLGVATYPWRQHLTARNLDRLGRPAVVALLLPYLLALAYVGGWIRAPRLSAAAAVARLDDVVWLPFFYQYYAPYQSTMYSAIVHVALYVPVGIMCWLWARRRDRVPLWAATLLAIVLALGVEFSKLFLAYRLPDFADVFIAAVAATLALAVLRLASRSPPLHRDSGAARDASARESGRIDEPAAAYEPVAARTGDEHAVDPAFASAGVRLLGALLLVVVAVTVGGFPVGSWALALALLFYAAAVRYYPTTVYLLAIPALLPIFDLAPISGRFFWDEFDLLLATTLGVRLLMGLPARNLALPLPTIAIGLLVISVAASTAIGIWPLAPIDPNAFSSYLSAYNALRVAKGYAWAGVVLWLMWRDASAGRKVVPTLQLGLGLGLATASISVYWERLLFLGSPGLDHAFRAAGFVSATHVGGAYLEAILVMLAPFGLALAVSAERALHRIIWGGVIASGAGAVLLTLSRAALAAWLASIAAFAVVWWLKSRSPRAVALVGRRRWGAAIVVLALLALTPLAAQSTYLRQRLAASNADLALRVAHWGETIGLMRTGVLHLALGNGLGSFPREFYVAYAGTHRLPAYRLGRDADSGSEYIALTGGRGMYLDQRIATGPGDEVRLGGLVRSPEGNARLSISLCEKSMLNSVRCDDAIVAAGPAWQPFEVRLALPLGGEGNLAPAAPKSLSLHNGMFGSEVDVTQLSLRDAPDALRNGSFKDGLDRWFVTSDVHLAWRVLNTPLQVAFEQGAHGILAWLMLCVTAVHVVLRSTALPTASAAFAGALTGCIVVGAFDSLLDSPRLIVLIALIGAIGLGSASMRVQSARRA